MSVKITPVDGYKRRYAHLVFGVDGDGVLYERNDDGGPWSPTVRDHFADKIQPGHRIDPDRPDVCVCGNDRFWLKGYTVVCPECGADVHDFEDLIGSY